MRTVFKNISPFNNKTDMPEILFIVKKVLSFWLCYISGLLIGECIAILLHFAMGKNMLVGDVFDSGIVTLIMYYGYIIVIAVVLFYWKLVEKRPFSEMGVSKRFGSYFVGVLIAVIMLLAVVYIVIISGNIEYEGIFENSDILTIILFMGGFVVQGAMEEVLCRGFLFHALKKKTSRIAAAIVSTLMFILPHCSSLFEEEIIYGVTGIINLVLISIIFLYLTVYFKSIWAACGLHSFWNFILFNILGLNLSGGGESITAIFKMRSVGSNIWNGGIYGIEASIITTVILGIAVIILWIKIKKNKCSKTSCITYTNMIS